MKDKIEYEMIRVAKLEREVIGQLSSGDAEGLENNLTNATEFLKSMEAILKSREGAPNQEITERIRNTVDGLKRIIGKIGSIETIECDCCGDQVLQSATRSVDGKQLCVSCIDARME